MLPTTLQIEVQRCLGEALGKSLEIRNFIPCGGGSINEAGKIETSVGDFFIKWNDLKKYPGMFQAEARGLSLLSQAECINVAEVIASGAIGKFQFLILRYIRSAARKHSYWKLLGERLATLHRVSAAKFGLDHDNYIGSLFQHNAPTSSWTEFFINTRLLPQLEMAESIGIIPAKLRHDFERLFSIIDDLLPTEKPALLHGDLWSGNVTINEQGEPSLIDPAVYYGHREMDLAMTYLFGGFSKEFYDAYNTSFPLENGFRNRVDIHNLYPLMVHVNLFGGGYVNQVQSILRNFS